jgi:hypothetical protein
MARSPGPASLVFESTRACNISAAVCLSRSDTFSVASPSASNRAPPSEASACKYPVADLRWRTLCINVPICSESYPLAAVHSGQDVRDESAKGVGSSFWPP